MSYFAFKTEACNDKCPPNCPANFTDAFEPKMGEFVERTEANLIGKGLIKIILLILYKNFLKLGAQGRVYKGYWHGQEAACKVVPVDKVDTSGMNAKQVLENITKYLNEILDAHPNKDQFDFFKNFLRFYFFEKLDLGNFIMFSTSVYNRYRLTNALQNFELWQG